MLSCLNTKRFQSFPGNKRPNEGSISAESYSSDYLYGLLDRLNYESRQKSTRKNYHQVWTNFNKFLIKLDKVPQKWEQRLVLYCTHLTFVKRLKSATVKSYASAVKATLTDDGYLWDDKLLLMSTFTKVCKLKNDVVQFRLPIQRSLLEQIFYELERKYEGQPYLEILYKVAFSLAYYGLMRISELCGIHALKAKDIYKARQGDRYNIFLYTSKTHNTASPPQKIRIGKEHRKFCPVKILNLYVGLRKKYKNDKDPFLVFSDGSTPLKEDNFRSILREMLTNLTLDGKMYNTHSFRIGRATDLLKRGLTVEKIKQIGRWKSNAVYQYFKMDFS